MSTGTVLYPQAEDAAFAATMATTNRPALEDTPMSRMPTQYRTPHTRQARLADPLLLMRPATKPVTTLTSDAMDIDAVSSVAFQPRSASMMPTETFMMEETVPVMK